MHNLRRNCTLATFILVSLFGVTAARAGGDGPDTDSDAVGPTVLVTDLVSDVANLRDDNGIVHAAAVVDPHLVNAWGITESGASPFWISDNNAGVSTLYRVPGANNAAVTPVSLVVSIPAPGDPLGSSGTPTGTVFNLDPNANGFPISGVDKNGHPVTARSVFLFATEDGTIVGWNPGVNPPGFDPAKAGTYGIIAVDNSANPSQADGAVYKGLAIATDANGRTLLYATNFRAGTVEVYTDSFAPAPASTLAPDAFVDTHLKRGYAPFDIVPVGNKLFVTYAVQDAAKHDDVAGPSHGIVNTFDLSGGSFQRFAQHGHLNSPWGLVQAPASFGQFAGDILIGNFGNGRINAFDPNTGEFLGPVVNPNGQEILIDGLWALRVGNNGAGGSANTVYFTAGPNGETHGLFGSLTPVAPGTPCGLPCI